MLGVFLDSETNGLNSQVHKVMELAFKIVDLSTGEVKESFQALVAHDEEVWNKSDPNSLKINGFTFDEIAKGAAVHTLEREIVDLFQKWDIVRKKAVFICQNPSFDRVFFSQIVNPDTQERLRWPYHWLDLASMFWAICLKQGKLPWQIGCSKDAIATHYNLPKEVYPHRAMNGVDHLLLCYQAVVGFPTSRTPRSCH